MHTPRPKRLLAAVLAAAILAVAWSSELETIELDGYRTTFDPNQEFLVLEGDLDCTPSGGPAAVRVTETSGRLGEADYVVFQPADWNGDLVLFGHAVLSPFYPDGRFWFPLPLGFAPRTADMAFAQARDAALCQGFAWAASASEHYGASMAELTRSTHLLGALAGRHLAAVPARTFVTGLFAPGGLAALALAESHPHRYAGAVLVNVPVGGMRLVVDQVMHVAALLDVVFPDLLEYEREHRMMPNEFQAFASALQARAVADPSTLQRLASIRMPDSEQFDPDGIGHAVLFPDPTAPDATATFMSLGESVVSLMWNYLVLYDDVLTRGGGAFAGDNRHVVYRGDGWSAEDEADLNARVPRYQADRLAQRYWTLHYEPSGALQIPVVSVRGPWGQVPSHYWTYADRLNRSGGTDFFSEWVLATHEQEVLRQNMDTALRALVTWVETGVRPTWPTAP